MNQREEIDTWTQFIGFGVGDMRNGDESTLHWRVPSPKIIDRMGLGRYLWANAVYME